MALVALFWSAPARAQERLVVVARAATLTLPFDQLARQLPAWRFEQESGGSRLLLRKLIDLRPRVDVLALADASLLERAQTDPETRVATWWLNFARNELVLAYTPRSRHAAEINARNWYEILLRSDVSFGYANPNLDPEGYNTLIAWKLAERYYQRPGLFERLRAAVPARNLRDHSVALLALLESGEMDYSWQYRSVAEQHHLKYVALPPEINLGDPGRRHLYERVSVALAGSRPGESVEQRGKPIEYAVTIPVTAVNVEGAVAFIEALAGVAGRQVLRANFQAPLVPAMLEGESAQVPARLRSLTVVGTGARP